MDRYILSICAFTLYVTVIWCNRYSIDLLSIGVGGICILSICAFCYMWYMLFHTSIVLVGRGCGMMYPQYMCIL